MVFVLNARAYPELMFLDAAMLAMSRFKWCLNMKDQELRSLANAVEKAIPKNLDTKEFTEVWLQGSIEECIVYYIQTATTLTKVLTKPNAEFAALLRELLQELSIGQVLFLINNTSTYSFRTLFERNWPTSQFNDIFLRNLGSYIKKGRKEGWLLTIKGLKKRNLYCEQHWINRILFDKLLKNPFDPFHLTINEDNARHVIAQQF